MQEFVQPTEAILPSQRRPLGFLIEPMDWAARALIERANSPVTVSGRLLEIGRARMHVIAIALAHDTTESLSAEQLLHGRLSEILDQVLTPKPAGMRGVEAAFLGVGIPPAGVVEPIEALLSSVDPERHFRG